MPTTVLNSVHSRTILPHTTYLPATPYGVGPLVFRLKVPISRAESNFRYTGGTTVHFVLYPAFKGGQL
jgi:hypothetical protein